MHLRVKSLLHCFFSKFSPFRLKKPRNCVRKWIQSFEIIWARTVYDQLSIYIFFGLRSNRLESNIEALSVHWSKKRIASYKVDKYLANSWQNQGERCFDRMRDLYRGIVDRNVKICENITVLVNTWYVNNGRVENWSEHTIFVEIDKWLQSFAQLCISLRVNDDYANAFSNEINRPHWNNICFRSLPIQIKTQVDLDRKK